MDAFAHIPPTTRAKRDLLNDTMRAIRDLRPRVTLLIYDPVRMDALKAACTKPRTLLG